MNAPTGQMTDQERAFYRSEVAPSLPPVVLDFHAHTWSADTWKVKPWQTDRKGGRYMVTEAHYGPDRLQADGKRCFPDREYRAVCFGYPTPAADTDAENRFVAGAARTHRGMYPLMIAGRELGTPTDAYRAALDGDGFLGFKVFLNWLGDDYGEKTVEEMLGRDEVAVANERELVLLLHVPRNGRLADPVVQRGVERLSRDCANAKIVLAHCGRCYLPSEMKAAAGALRRLPNVFMDTSMVMDPLVLQIAMDAVGPGRLVYGTDFPVAVMRGRRVRVMNHWVDIVREGYPPSAFRVASNDIHATFMALEIAVAIRDASLRNGLGDEARHGIFFGNGMRLLRGVMGGRQIEEVESRWP